MRASEFIKEQIQLNELREYLDPNEYGGWINIDGRVENVNSHEIWLKKQYDTFDYTSIDDLYTKAFDDGWVRTINDRNSFIVHGNVEIIRKTFRYWWPSAIQSRQVYIEKNDLGPLTVTYTMPIDKIKLKQDFQI